MTFWIYRNANECTRRNSKKPVWTIRSGHSCAAMLVRELFFCGYFPNGTSLLFLELLCLLLTGSGIESMKLKAARDHILVPLLQSTIFLKRYRKNVTYSKTVIGKKQVVLGFY